VSPTLRTRFAISVGRAAARASQLAGRGEGMVVGGKITLKLAPRAIADLANGRVAALVSATNGKTSTTRLLANAVEQLGPVLTAQTGANMTSGVVTVLANGGEDTVAVLEVDEAYLPMVTADTNPRVILLGNLSRDQLDRMSEVAMTARKWRKMLAQHPEVIVVANADDPVVTYAAEQAPKVVWVAGGQVWTADSAVCPECGTLLTRDGASWHCTGCQRARPDPTWFLEWVDGVGAALAPDGKRYDLSGLLLPGRFNASNATMALAVCGQLGLNLPESVDRMCRVDAVSGRYAVVDVGAVRIRLLLAKNPAGWTELIDVMPPAPAPVIVTINSNSADGRDPSWLWDVPFERLRGRTVIATGDRRRDLAVRLLHADVDHVVIADPYAVGAPLPTATRNLDVIDNAATYTGFHALRTRAAREAGR
jgi:UDP-N-acetylmuramyl tripeptide synthase